jgi:Uma2 family endonuclease
VPAARLARDSDVDLAVVLVDGLTESERYRKGLEHRRCATVRRARGDLRLEEFANVKHEFFEGRIFAMAGGTPEHGALAVRVATALSNRLRGKRCNVYSSDTPVRVVATGLDTYPDVSVVCSSEQRDREDRLALVNPIVLVEVLSPSTEAYDRGDKLEHYRRIPTLEEVVLVAWNQPAIDVWRRRDVGRRRLASARARSPASNRSAAISTSTSCSAIRSLRGADPRSASGESGQPQLHKDQPSARATSVIRSS